MMYYIRYLGQRWKVREAVSLDAACRAIVSATVSGSVGSKQIRDETYIGGTVIVEADVVKVNSDYSERAAYTQEY